MIGSKTHRMKTVFIVFILTAVMANGYGRIWGHGGHRDHHHHHHHHGPPMPPYLRNASEEARREYRKIMSNDTMTIAQQKKEIEEWAKRNNVEEQVKEFNANMTKHRDEVRKNVTSLINFLSKALEQSSKILDDENQTRPQMKEKMRQLIVTFPEAFNTLKFAFAQYKPERGPHGHKHHGRRIGWLSDEDDSWE
ncbi:hypothetical protein V3C99_009982 [Haemonchus contortus]